MAYSKEKIIQIGEYFQKNGEEKTLRYYKIKSSSLERILRYNKTKDSGQDQYDFERIEAGDELELNLRSYELKTVDELLSYSKIDTDIWEVYKVVTNTWGSETNPNFQIKAWLKRKELEKIDIEKTCNYIIDKISKYSIPNIIKHTSDKEGFLWEVGLVDHHLGQLSWDKEVGINYDVNIAQKLYNESIAYLIDKVQPYKINKILYIVGHDFFNVSSQFNTTTAGTRQAEDGRYQRSFNRGIDIHVDAINYLKKIANVDAIIIPGNHSGEREFYLGAVLQAWFKNDKNVSIDNRPISRKYYRYGKNLLGLAHADPKEIKLDRLLGLMPIEAKEDWSLTTNYEWHLGHLHHDAKMQHDLKTENGIKIRRLNTLVAIDDWHFNSGYVRVQEAQTFLWHPEFADIHHINHRI